MERIVINRKTEKTSEKEKENSRIFARYILRGPKKKSVRPKNEETDKERSVFSLKSLFKT
jgi:hypothetical protein